MERREALKNVALWGGTAIVGTSLLSLLQSCQQQPKLNWKPTFFNENQAEFISSLVDTLLPKTQTPGALDMKVDIFIDAVANQLFDEAGQKSMIDGIEKFDTNCREMFGKRFVELDSKEKAEILKAAEANSGKFNGQVWGTAVGTQQPVGFYRSVKSLAIWAYFSSKEIGTTFLNYDPIPGDYKGCIPLSEIGNTWSL